jgi:hypothetical protein
MPPQIQWDAQPDTKGLSAVQWDVQPDTSGLSGGQSQQQPALSQMLDRARAKIGQQKPVPPPGSGIDRPLTEIGNMGNQLLQSIYDLLPPNVANEMYKKRAGLPNRLAEIAPEAVMTVAPMALGAEERPYTPGAVSERAAVQPAAAESGPGVMGTVARHLPYIGKYIRAADVLGDLLDSLKGKPEAPPTPAPPQVPANWGKPIPPTGPPEQWGQRIQSAPSPAAVTELPPMPTGTVPRVLSGEGVIRQALTSLDNKSLLTVARSRGINVTAEANLKPGIADNRIITKILDDFSDEELDNARDIGIETSRNPAIAGNVSPEALRVQILQTFFPEAKIPQAALMRYRKALAQRNAAPLSTLLAVPNQ